MLERKNYLPLALLGLIFILTSLILALTWDLKNYQLKYDKYKVSERSSISAYESIKIVRQTMDYLLKGQKENIIGNYYSPDELSHLKDLRNIFISLRWIRNISGLVGVGSYLLMSPGQRREFQTWFLKFLGLAGLGLLACVVYFKKFFYLLHIVIFKDESWLLDRTSSILIQFMPELLFRDLLVKLILAYALIMLIISLKIYLIDRSWKIRV